MDTAAKQYWIHTHEIPLSERPNKDFEEPGSVWLQNEKIVIDLKERLLNFKSSMKAIPYWEKKLHLDEGVGPRIQPSALTPTLDSGFFGSGKMMLRWKLRSDASCPRCS